MIGNSVTGKTLGIIGMGRIGRMAAKCAKAFGMKMIYYNRNKLSEDLEDGSVTTITVPGGGCLRL
jgi:glyoxylate reductase